MANLCKTQIPQPNKSRNMPKKIILHLPKGLKKSVDADKHNFFKILRQTLESVGYKTETREQKKHSGMIAKFGKNHHIFHIDGAVGPRAVNVRQAHFYPFWSLENAGTRREPRIAGKIFDPAAINALDAQEFFNKTCVRNIPNTPSPMAKDDFILVPLQGRLLTQRKWQYTDCKQMIDTILEQDPSRKILIKPHPRESYSADEQAFIDTLTQSPRISIAKAGTHSLLTHCAYVVTQNSALAFQGFLFQKPAILFAKSDFHHICQSIKTPDQAADAFAKTVNERPAFEKYIYWYLQLNCINAGRADVGAAILDMLRECGWDI